MSMEPEPVTDFVALAFLFLLFFMALGMMFLVAGTRN